MSTPAKPNTEGTKELEEILVFVERAYETLSEEVRKGKVSVLAVAFKLMGMQALLEAALKDAGKAMPELLNLSEEEFKKVFGEHVTNIAYLLYADVIGRFA